MKKKVVFLLAAVLMMASCREKGGLDAAEQTSFETMTVSKQDITLEQSYPAQIDGRQSVKIIPRVEGYLRQICVKEGQRVKKGQVLFVIDQATYQAEVKAEKSCMERLWSFSRQKSIVVLVVYVWSSACLAYSIIALFVPVFMLCPYLF